MDAKAIDFVSYVVSDLETATAFYRDTLGLEQETLLEDVGWAEFAVPPTTLALREADGSDPVAPSDGGATVALAVDDVEAAVEELRGEEVAVLDEPIDTGVCDLATVADPDGNPITLHRRHDGSAGRRDPLP